MLKSHTICASLFLVILSLTNAQAQGDIARSATPEALTITASASDERVRFTAPASVVQIRLEVYASTGKKLFDNELRGGNVLDWHLQNGQAEPLLDDTYLCVVTVKNLSGRITQRIGSVRVEKGVASLQPAVASQMTAQQSDAIGPVEENAPLTIVNDGEPRTATVIAHNGTEGQLIRGQGALSFRIGDFYRGKDTEQMRLTSEGNLGIGITNPQVRLDVDGVIRASQGIVFPDGSTQYSAASKTLGAKSTLADQASDQFLGGKHKFQTQSVTQNHIVKFTDGGGTLGDSGITETAGGFVGIGEPSADSLLNIKGAIPLLLGHIAMIRTTGSNNGFGLLMDATGTGNNNLALSVGGVPKAGFGWDIARNFIGYANLIYSSNDFSLRLNANGSLTFHDGASSAERFRITASGNVGIGTNSPQQNLSVNSALNVDQANTNNGSLNPGITFGSGSGEGISSKRTAGGNLFGLDFYTNFSNRLSILNNGNVGIGTTIPTKKLVVGGGTGNSGILNDGISVNISGGAVITARDSTTGVEVQMNAETSGIGTVGTFSNHPLNFRTNNIERVRIDTGGKVSIGATASPSAKLYVEGIANAVHGKNTGTSGIAGFFEITNPASSDNALFVTNQGSGAAVVGTAFGTGDGVVGAAFGGGFAGRFNGDINVTGRIFAGTKDFKIDHPLDPANKYLVHASIESSEVKNLYDGVVVLDPSGEAIVVLPDWFESLNRDFRYQLTCIGGSAQVYIAEEIANHRFKIAGGGAGMKVSWQVTGNRQDPFIKAHPMRVEEAKPEIERGFYIHPELYGQPEEMGIQWARHPEQMRQMKEQREKRSLPKQ